jgi:hypothetical protein
LENRTYILDNPNREGDVQNENQEFLVDFPVEEDEEEDEDEEDEDEDEEMDIPVENE